jgi:uncharacterized protein YndB with AHSA1/START domain
MKYAGTLVIAGKGDREVTMTRRFNAPPALVFEAFTTPALLKRWMLGPSGTTMPVCEVDFRVGGAYRSVWIDPQIDEMSASGIYREIDAPHRFVATERFVPPWYPGEAVITITFVPHDGDTEVTTSMRYESTEGRDQVLQTPMAEGVTQSYDRLATILEETKAAQVAPRRRRAWIDHTAG